MAIAGAAFGASRALEDIVAQRILAQKLEAEIADRQSRLQLDQDRLSESNRASLVDEGQRQQTIEGTERNRRDRNNDRGIDLMKSDRAEMDMDAAVNTLPANLKPMGPLMRSGLVGKLSPEDLQSPEDREREAQAAEEREIRIRSASRAPQAPRERKQVWVKRGDQVLPIEEGTAQPGDAPYDAVAARSSQPVNPTEAQDTAREAGRLASELVKHPGFGGAFGLAGSYMPTVRQGTADAEQLLDGLTGLLTMENMGKMKGVLSDADMKILRQASTTLSSRMSEGAARNELNRVVEVMGRVAGEAPISPGGGAGEPIQKPIPGIPGAIAESVDGGKTWKRVK